MELNRKQTVLLVAALAVVAVVGIALAVPSLRSPVGEPMEQVQEPPLPTDPGEAWAEVQTRHMADLALGMAETEVKERHQRRLDEYRESREAVTDGGD